MGERREHQEYREYKSDVGSKIRQMRRWWSRTPLGGVGVEPGGGRGSHVEREEQNKSQEL